MEPPRGRGKVDGPPAQVGRGRITPAQAGRSPYFLYGKKDYKDHPRIGGEKAELTAAVISAMGSPPRRRGKGYREFGIDISDRITPAQAGKSVAPRQKRSALWDHPRVGGEKYSRPSYSRISMGSPPRGRGKAGSPATGSVSPGITPAWAGKSSPAACSAPLRTDHPRMGGEKSFSISSTYCATGSPPRRQGKANWHCVRRPALRITPAQAGKRTRSWRAYGCPWDHPRVGGEKLIFVHLLDYTTGSPPHRRGKAYEQLQSGITPAQAGKRRQSSHCLRPDRDHPRAGGEKFSSLTLFGL